MKRNGRENLGCDEKIFIKIVKAGYNQKRKTLRNSLKSFNLNLNSKTEILLQKRAEESENKMDDQLVPFAIEAIKFIAYIFLISIIFVPFAIGSFFNRRNNYINWNNFNFNFDLDMHNMFGFLSFGSLAGIIYIIGIALVIIASIKAREGQNYTYPFTIKFIK